MKPLDFVILAIEQAKAKAKASGKDYKGLHTVYSGFNDDYRALFGNENMSKEALKALPIAAVKQLVEEGKIEMHYAFGGAMIYLKGEMPNIKAKVTKESVMKKYGLTPPPVIAPKKEKKAQATAAA